ncbi:MAG: hypothetical protein EOP33_04865 [Rickettsiaceae bacterium]|nr:MAG: hypothetical protein EOP33_04865 [Rickettsiaceae bacterium]
MQFFSPASFINPLAKSLIYSAKVVGALIITGLIFYFAASLMTSLAVNFFTHPAISVFIAVVLMLIFYRFDLVFKTISMIYPVISIYSLLFASDLEQIKILNLNCIISDDVFFVLLAAVIILITGVINIYAISRNRKAEVVVAGLYLGSSLIALFSLDFISQFVAIELMAICATIIIFMGDNSNSIKAAKSYFLTHMFSGSLILIGICYIFTTSGDVQIDNLVYLINHSQFEQQSIFYYLLIFGCLINVAAFPFSNWMINCYPAASSSGFVYLNLFTTKISIILIIKLFCGLQLLKYFGVAMIIYGSIYACIENNNRKISCYLAVAQLGLMLIGISIGTTLSILGVLLYLLIYTLYKSLLALVFAILSDEAKIENCDQLKIIKSWPVNIALCFSLLMMLGIPFGAGFLSKSLLCQDLHDNTLIYLLKTTSIVVFLSLPIKKLLWNQQSVKLQINKYITFSLLILIMTLLIFNYLMIYNYQLIFKHSLISHFDKVTSQIVIIIIGILLSFIAWPKISARRFDFDGLVMSIVIFRIIYLSCLRIKLRASNKINNTSNYVKTELVKINLSNDQSTALATVVILLTIMLMKIYKL